MAKIGDVKVPGEVAEPPQDAPATVTISKADLEALIARAASAQPRAVPAREAAENLPDQSTVDTSKIERPVLTKQGWVVPVKFGTHQNAPKD